MMKVGFTRLFLAIAVIWVLLYVKIEGSPKANIGAVWAEALGQGVVVFGVLVVTFEVIRWIYHGFLPPTPSVLAKVEESAKTVERERCLRIVKDYGLPGANQHAVVLAILNEDEMQ